MSKQYIIGKFLIERGAVTDNKDGTFIIYYRVFYSDDAERKNVLYRGHVVYDGDQQKLSNKVSALLSKLDNANLDNAIDEIDQVLASLQGT